MVETEPISEKEKSYPLDAIIVLGSGIEEKAGRLEPGSPDGKMRVIAAAEAYRQELTPVLIFSGGRTKGKSYPSEAEVMAAFLNRKYKNEKGKFSRIPEEAIILEDQSIDTSENIKNSLRRIQKMGAQKMGVLTNAYHLSRVFSLAEKLGFGPESIKAETKLIERDPRFKPLIENFYLAEQMRKTRAREKKFKWISQKPGGITLLAFLARVQRR